MTLQNEGVIQGIITDMIFRDNKAYGKFLWNKQTFAFIVFDENVNLLRNKFLRKEIIKVKYELLNLQNKRLKKYQLNNRSWVDLDDNWEPSLKITGIK